jgi:lipopolysaccharide export system permease protein
VPKFDRYLLAQLLVVFGFFALILILIYWVNRAVGLFDQLIANGQNAVVFLEMTALSLPNVIRHVLPMAAFAASVYVGNRLASESELVVVQATGYSPARLSRPVLVFGLFVGTLVSILTHVLVPASYTEYNRRQAEISENVTARFLTEGTFLHPADGVTFYIREITRDGELTDIFLSDSTQAQNRTLYTARRALLVRSETGPKLVMFDGMAQTLRVADRSLAVTAFEDFSYDIGALLDTAPKTKRSLREISTAEALWPTPEVIAETRANRGQLLYEGHGRVAQGPQALVAALVGFAALLVGGFSRFGMWRQIIGGVVALIFLKTLDNAAAGLVRTEAAPWPMMYLGVVAGLLLAWILLKVAERPSLFVRREATT